MTQELTKEEAQRIEALAAEVLELEKRVLDLGKSITREEDEVLTRVICAAAYLDRARQRLTRRIKPAHPEDKIGQNETPPIPDGEDMVPEHRRRPGRR